MVSLDLAVRVSLCRSVANLAIVRGPSQETPFSSVLISALLYLLEESLAYFDHCVGLSATA
jgi:hypothetical protein